MDRFKVYRQLNSNDCALCCVQMICTYYNNTYSLSTIRKYCESTRLGISIENLKQCLSKLGFKVLTAKLSLDAIKKAPLPTILFWKGNHFVVLYKMYQKNGILNYYIADPSFGKINLEESVFESYFMKDDGFGIALILEPTDSFYASSDNHVSLWSHWIKIIEYLKNIIFTQKGKFILVFVLSLFSLCVNWMIPIFFQQIIDKGILLKNMDLVYILAMGQFVLFFSYIISDGLSNIFISKIGYTLGISFLSDYLNKLVRLPMSFFDVKIGSDLIQLVDDQDNLKSFFTYETISILFSISNLIVFSSILFYYNSLIFLCVCFFSMLSVFWFFFFLRKRKILNYTTFSALSDEKNDIYELVAGMQEIRVNSCHKLRVSRIREKQHIVDSCYLKDLHLNYYMNLGVVSFGRLKDVVIVVICSSLVVDNQMTLGMLMTISYVLGQLNEPLNRLFGLTRDFQNAKYSLERLNDIQNFEEESRESKWTLDGNIVSGISLKNISFRYAGMNSFVLQNITLDIPKNSVTAIVGSSGSGKTTLLKLLLAFYYPQKGNIFIDHIKMSDIDPESWRENCGVVLQDGLLFSGTIIENIAISDRNPDIVRVQNAASIACIEDFIERLPLKYDTRIGNKGIGLSGGQKQRLLIARAIYRNPDFIFFDEATSFLDTTNESNIMKNIKRYCAGKTVVIIAHRLSTVKDADNIVVLGSGKLLEQGSHEELISMKGFYYQLVKDQLELEYT